MNLREALFNENAPYGKIFKSQKELVDEILRFNEGGDFEDSDKGRNSLSSYLNQVVNNKKEISDNLLKAIARVLENKIGLEKTEEIISNLSKEDEEIKNFLSLEKMVLKDLGIIGTSVFNETSVISSKEIMKRAESNIDFMGIQSSKWLDEEGFEDFLIKIQKKGGFVRFLTLNPDGECFKKLKTVNGKSLNDNGTKSKLKSLQKQFAECFEVKYYDFLPSFRLVFIDDELLGFSAIKIDSSGRFLSKLGWGAPQLIIEKGEFWSLYDPFYNYFNNVWYSATELSI